MTEWIVRRWARYGRERLYAETPGGTALGYLDLKTGRYHSDDLSNLPLLEKAIGDYLAAHPVAVPSGPAAVTEGVRAELAPAPEWTDTLRLPPRQVEAIYEVARRSTTWR